MKSTIDKVIESISNSIKESVEKCVKEALFSIDAMPEVNLEVPREKSHGDFSTNIAMQLTKQAKKPPRLIGEAIVSNLVTENTYIDKIEIAGPGFINFYLKKVWLYEVLNEITEKKDKYGYSQIGNGKKVNVEYISANPTGPMHMGNARGGAIGDGIAAVLERAGYEVSKEFYINDAGNQIEKFGESLEARYLQQLGQDVQFPEDGYQGEDIIDHAKNFIELHGDKYLNVDTEERRRALIDYALNLNLQRIKDDLGNYGVNYDTWFSETTLHESGQVIKVIEELKSRGYAYEKDGATWFKATDFGCEKDDVLIRNNGIPTYFAADIAYHVDKLRTREFDWAINIWGADHHGHVARLKAALKALGIDENRLTVVLMQLVRLTRRGEVERMSKRAGRMVSLADLIEEVGKDAARFFFNLRSPDSHLDFDLELAVEESNENPVFYVQYAHARICSILRQLDANSNTTNVDLNLLKEKEEFDLMRKLADLPQEIIKGAKKLDPSCITKYSLELASSFHSFYNACRVRVDDEDLMKARILLIQCTRQVLKNCLDILGVSAPEKM